MSLPNADTPRPSTVLVVDDEATLRETLDYNLRREGYRVLTAADGPEAVRLAYAERPDLVILDVMLPGMSGLEVCRALRRELTTPILMLSAREEEIDKVLGLELGADDYLSKPFGLRELLARVRALLRRVPPPAAASPSARPAVPLLEAGALVIDAGRRTVTRAGVPLALQPKEFDLLAFLAAHPGQVFSRQALLDAVWGYDFVGGDRTVDVHIRWLRRKIEADPARPTVLETVYGVGYKLAAAGAGRPAAP
ncbi:MAG TPA: response regulator transcription factor [Chloroflexia bacterium]|nr:response regulator transcription factor [Chloroflexia bacterium]